MPVHRHRRPTLRRTRLLAAVGLLALALSACTAHMDMTLKDDSTYDVVLDMRDSTGTVLTPGTDCADYANPALVGSPEGTSVSSRTVGSDGDIGGIGCEVTISGVPVPDADAVRPSSDGSAPLVVRAGDLYVVDLSVLNGTFWLDGGGQGGAPSQEGVVDARVTLTFPGAVVTSNGGIVEGTTVTWSDAAALADGVSASGYASPGAGLSVWDRYSGWILGVVVALGLTVGAAAWRRNMRIQ